MDVNPCEGCTRPCPYHLFIDCPAWLAWAEEKNSAEMEDGVDG